VAQQFQGARGGNIFANSRAVGGMRFGHIGEEKRGVMKVLGGEVEVGSEKEGKLSLGGGFRKGKKARKKANCASKGKFVSSARGVGRGGIPVIGEGEGGRRGDTQPERGKTRQMWTKARGEDMRRKGFKHQNSALGNGKQHDGKKKRKRKAGIEIVKNDAQQLAS